MSEENKFKLWSELHPEVKPQIRKALRWYYFKKSLKSLFKKLTQK